MAPIPPSTKRSTHSHPSKTPHNPPTSKRSKRTFKHATLLSRITKTAPRPPSQKTTKRRRPSKKLIATLDSLADALPELSRGTAAGGNDDDDDGAEEKEDEGGKRGEGREGGEARQGVVTSARNRTPNGDIFLIKHKSLKSRPGAGKRKEKLVAMERERFARNLAEMAAGSVAAQNATGVDGRMVVDEGGGGGGGGTEGDNGMKGGSGSAERWAAIRGFIRQTMERRPETEGMR